LIAGGERAISGAVEHVEDDPLAAAEQLKNLGLYQNDIVCGIAASGRTPYVIGGLDYARSVGAGTISVANNKHSEIGRHADVAIEVETGPEALSGSTRLKAGTAQKMVLNLLSTATMIQQGKTYSNLMVDVKATNEKLHARCLNILREIFPAVETEHLAEALASAKGSVKLAAVIIKTELPVEQARAELERHDGHLRRVFGEA
jgi:N-acetylmuramic acid 6-phosphate etherase